MKSMRSDSIPATWTPYILSITRIIFGFLIVRHGMEQWFGYPEASDYPMSSFSGIVELVEFPAGLLLMLGLFTRPVALLVSVLVGISYFTGPALKGPLPIRTAAIRLLSSHSSFSLSQRMAPALGVWTGFGKDPQRKCLNGHLTPSAFFKSPQVSCSFSTGSKNFLDSEERGLKRT